MSNGSKLIEVADLIMGQSPPSETYNEEGVGLPFYQGKSDFGATYPTPRIFCIEPLRIAEPGDILMSVRAPVGATNLCKERSCIGRGLTAIRPIGIDRYFLYFNLKHIESYLESLGTGAIFKAINKHQLSQATVNEVGFDSQEQQRIAQVLNTVQEAIAQQERLIRTTTELKQALKQKLFTEGLRGEKLKETEMGPVPESWKLIKLEEAGDVIYGIQAAVAGNHKPIGTPILTNKNITLDGSIVTEKLDYYELKSKRDTATILRKGDLLFNWRSGSKDHVGKTAYFELDGDWVHSSFILRIRPRSEVNGRYLFYYLNHLREIGYFVKLQTYSINAKFNKSAINILPTAIPSRAEQDQIVAAMDGVQRRIESALAKKRLLEDLFRTLLQELMTGKVRLGVQ